jgi:hypothetical protein
MGRREYEQVGSAEDVSNVNYMTDPAFGANMGLFNQLRNTLYGGGGQGGQFRGLMESGDPTAAYNWFLGASPAFQQVAMDVTNPFVAGQMQMANMVSPDAVSDVAAQYGGSANSYYSGAAANAMLDKAAQVRQNAVNNALQMQTQTAGSLLNNALGTAPGAFGQKRQQDIGLFGLGQNAMMGGLQGATALGAPEWYQPTYAAQPNALDYISGIGGAAAGIGGALMGMPGLGTALGGLLGGFGTRDVTPGYNYIPGSVNPMLTGPAYGTGFRPSTNYLRPGSMGL